MKNDGTYTLDWKKWADARINSDQDLRASHKQILRYIASLIHNDRSSPSYGMAYPKLATMATALGLSVRRISLVRRQCEELHVHGTVWLAVEKRGNKNFYYLPVLQPEMLLDPSGRSPFAPHSNPARTSKQWNRRMDGQAG